MSQEIQLASFGSLRCSGVCGGRVCVGGLCGFDGNLKRLLRFYESFDKAEFAQLCGVVFEVTEERFADRIN